MKYKLTATLYAELYDFYWQRADLRECTELKRLFYSSDNKKTSKTLSADRRTIIRKLKRGA